ncbi:MAG: glycosyltransferase family 39 protein [Patescibacteria group bacterium]
MNSFIKKNIYYIILLVIIFISLFLRLYKINSNPPSLDWDEVSMGYNAYSLLKTGADEYGNRLPLNIRSFGDYKPPLYTYLAVPSISVFGFNETGVRFPSAVFGFLSVIVIYFLVKEIFKDWDKQRKEKLALLTALFWGVSPWSLQFSRTAFEGNVGLFFFMLGFLLFLKGLKNPKIIAFAVISFSLSVYSYHSFVLVVPLFIIFCLLFFRKEVFTNIKYYIFALVIGLLFAIPVVSSFVSTGGSGSRLSMVSIFETDILIPSIKQLEYDRLQGDTLGALFDNRRVVYFLTVAKNYFDHWNPDFLFFNGDGGKQHHAVNMGMLYLWELPFILLGVYHLLQKRTKSSLLIVIAFLIAPLPSAFSTGTPHPVRAIVMAPFFSMFSALGVINALQKISNIKYQILKIRIKYLIFSLGFLFFIFNFFYYIHKYYVHTPIEYSDWWQYGNKEALSEAKSLEGKYGKIIYTYKYDQPYIYYLFYNKIDPFWYQKNWDYLKTGNVERMKRIIGKYEFRNINWERDSKLNNALLIGSPEEIPENAKGLIKTIYFLDGSVAFRVVGT